MERCMMPSNTTRPWGLLLLAGLLLAAVPARAETLLRLSETATVMAHPDELNATLRAETVAASPAEAQRRVNATMADAMAAAKKAAGLTWITVGTGGYFVGRVGPTPQDRAEHWQASQSLELTSFDGAALLKLVGELQQKGLAVTQLDWRLSDNATRAARTEATKKAIAALRGRADEAAALLDLRFGSFKEVRLDSPRPAPPFTPRVMMMAGAAASVPASPPNAEPADVSISATADADVQLLPK
jgi:predicted secreted protein